jgi:hypothetical protein
MGPPVRRGEESDYHWSLPICWGWFDWALIHWLAIICIRTHADTHHSVQFLSTTIPICPYYKALGRTAKKTRPLTVPLLLAYFPDASVHVCYRCLETGWCKRSRGNEYARNNRNIVGPGVFFAVCVLLNESKMLQKILPVLRRTSCNILLSSPSMRSSYTNVGLPIVI